MTFEIEMPHVGESVTEAVIEKWLKRPGDRIEKYEPIVEVITDKVAMEIPAPATGELTKIVAQEGETVAMGAVLAEMDAEDGPQRTGDGTGAQQGGRAPSLTDASQTPTATASRPQSKSPARAGLLMANADQVGAMITGANVGPTGGAFSDTSLGQPDSGDGDGTTPDREIPTSTASSTSFARLSPAVRKLISAHGIDAATLTGTGVGGRITRADVLKAVENSGSDESGAVAPAGRVVKPSPVRRMIAGHMSKSFREIPHAWSAIEVDVSGLVACRAANRDSVLQQHRINLTYLPFALAVTAEALRSNSLLNSSWQTDGILTHEAINVGIAAAGKDGLVVPVIKNADTKSILELATELHQVVDRARDGKLSLEDVSGGTFTLNNTGALGSVLGGAIINHPQAAILTTEAIVKRPIVVTGDQIEVRSMMNICLSFDHRVIDGVEAAKFMQDVKRGLEEVSADTALE